jgi:competence protein ComEA
LPVDGSVALRWVLPVVIAVGVVLTVFTWQRQRTPETLITIAPLPSVEVAPLTVFVGGAVARPGVYTLTPGERVEAAIAAAGGFTDEANPDGVNRAARLRDEDQVIVPRKGEPPLTLAGQTSGAPAAGSASGSVTPTVSAGPIDVNTANVDELARLPGVGPHLAQAIIDYRTENGPFTSLGDLAQVKGISERMATSWADLITFGP